MGGGGFLDIAGPRPLRCACGTEFGKYMEQAVDEPFPYSATGPVDQTITNVWQGRRLRVLPPRDGLLTNVPEPHEQNERRWQTGKVVKLCQWNSQAAATSAGVPLPTLYAWGMGARCAYSCTCMYLLDLVDLAS